MRAGVATTLEDCEFTSIRERLEAIRGGKDVKETGLMPFKDQAPRGETPLTLPFADYAEVLRWAAASVRESREGPPPPKAASCLNDLGLNPEGFLSTMRTYAKSFFTMVSRAHRIDVESVWRGYKRRPGIRAARDLYRSSEAAKYPRDRTDQSPHILTPQPRIFVRTAYSATIFNPDNHPAGVGVPRNSVT